jgi:hypothetical protein
VVEPGFTFYSAAGAVTPTRSPRRSPRLIDAGLVASYGVIDSELGWATWSSEEFDQLRIDRDTGYEWLAIHDGDWRRA